MAGDAERPTGSGARPTAMQVDLGLRFPIHSVSVDAGSASDGAAMRVAFSDDGESWSNPAPDETAGPGHRPGAIKIAQGDGSWARYVRLTAPGSTGAEPASAEVWCARSMLDLITLRRILNVDFPLLHERPGLNAYCAYSFAAAEDLRSTAPVGVAMYENGAFGNCLIQLLLAIGVAKNLDLRYLKMPAADRSEMIDLTQRRSIAGITFIPAHEPLPSDGYFLSGMFFDVAIQKLAGDLDAHTTRWIVDTYIRPLFSRLPSNLPPKAGDELIIHIRSGDIFSTWVAPHYPQPPLAFYRMVVARLRAEGRIVSVKLVFENRLNPVIAELEAHLRQIGMPFTVQSGSLADDVAALLDGRYLVFGLGTFGPGVCQLSERIEQVFYFASNWPQHFKSIATIDKVVEVVDVAGAYTKVGEWDNSPARRAMMIDYPIENLAFDDAAG